MFSQISDSYEPISDINVTPFVDVLLVLLVIFMITAPLLTKALDVQLPEENLHWSNNKSRRNFIITLDKKGKYFIKGKSYSAKNLLRAAIIWKEKNPEDTAFIRADERVVYGKMMKLVVMLKNNGIQRLGFLIKDKP